MYIYVSNWFNKYKQILTNIKGEPTEIVGFVCKCWLSETPYLTAESPPKNKMAQYCPKECAVIPMFYFHCANTIKGNSLSTAALRCKKTELF